MTVLAATLQASIDPKIRYIQNDPFIDEMFALHSEIAKIIRERKVDSSKGDLNFLLLNDVSKLRQFHQRTGISISDVIGSFSEYEDLVARIFVGLNQRLSEEHAPIMSSIIGECERRLRSIQGYKQRITLAHVEMQQHFNIFIEMLGPEEEYPDKVIGELFRLRNEYFMAADTSSLKAYVEYADSYMRRWFFERRLTPKDLNVGRANVYSRLIEQDAALEVAILLA